MRPLDLHVLDRATAITGGSLWAVARIPMEVGILGWRLARARVASTLVFPPIARLSAHALFGR